MEFEKDMLFHCQHRVYTSTAFLFDGERDCNNLQNNSHDESILHLFASAREECQYLFYKNIQGKCKSFTNDGKPTIDTLSGKGTHDCKDGLSVIQTRVNDLVPDCGGAEDEELYVNLLKHRNYMLCDSSSQIPCVPGHPACYNISQICVYRLNVNNDFTPCRTGSHI